VSSSTSTYYRAASASPSSVSGTIEYSPSSRSTRNAMQGSGDVIDYLFYPTLVDHIHLNE
jgi:hypothetical protein